MSPPVDWRETQAKAWLVVNSIIKSNGLAHHQISSYNWFINEGVSRIVTQYKITYPDGDTVSFSNPCFRKPEHTDTADVRSLLTPYRAQILGLTYAAECLIDLSYNYKDGRPPLKKEKQHLCYLPVMLLSELCLLSDMDETELQRAVHCPHDPGGYFIVGTSQTSNSSNPSGEKVLIGQERLAYNQVFVFKPEEAEVRCQNWVSDNMTTVRVVIESSTNVISVNFDNHSIPLWIIFRILGLDDYNTIISLIDWDYNTKPNKDLIAELYPTIKACSSVDTRKKAFTAFIDTLKQVQEDRPAEAKRLIKNSLFHVFPDLSLKAVFLGYMVRRLLLVKIGQAKCDDRDNYANKRVDTAGELMYILFRFNFLNKVIKKMDLEALPKDRFEKIIEELRHSRLSDPLRKSLSSGEWPSNTKHGNASVSQTLSRINFPALLSSLRGANASANKNSKSAEAKNYSNSQTGSTCPLDTPNDKDDIGLNKKLSMSSTITVPEDPSSLFTMLATLPELNELKSIADIISFGRSSAKEASLIFVNGLAVYWCADPDKFVFKIKKLRRKWGMTMLNVAHRYKEIHLHYDGGRVTRPLLVVDSKGRPLIERIDIKNCADWYTLIEKGVIEYIDVCEADTIFCYEGLFFADKERYAPSQSGQYRTHCEIHPSLIFGIGVQTAVYPDMIPGPRGNYQATMGRNCVGVPSETVQRRWDTEHSIMYYPQKRLVISEGQKIIKQDELPTGQACVVAIGSLTGYSIEDGTVWNRASIDRGLGRFIKFKVVSESSRVHNNGSMDRFGQPQNEGVSTAVRVDYTKLDEDGAVEPGTPLNSRDVIIGKITVSKNTKMVEDSSVQLSADGVEADGVVRNDDGSYSANGRFATVSDVMMCEAGDGYQTVREKISLTHVPEIGDKWASCQAQKGTMGFILNEVDMPWTADGMCPDLILNSHCMPSQHYCKEMKSEVHL